jgi:hypothetical protein
MLVMRLALMAVVMPMLVMRLLLIPLQAILENLFTSSRAHSTFFAHSVFIARPGFITRAVFTAREVFTPHAVFIARKVFTPRPVFMTFPLTPESFFVRAHLILKSQIAAHP